MLLVVPLGCEEPAEPAPEPEPEPGARASEFRSAPVDEVLEAAAQRVRTRGFSAEGDDWRGFVVQRETEVADLPMRAGTCYVVVGVGSEALRELDLLLFDSDGAEVARDGQTGPRVAVHYCPPQSGTHYLGVRATTGNGLFAVRRFEGPTGLDVRIDELFAHAAAQGGSAPERP